VTIKRKALGDARASRSVRTGSVVSDSAVVRNYTTSVPPDIQQSPCLRLVTWFRCYACHRGYFTTGAPGPQPCPACGDGGLQPVGLWDLRTEATPPGMLRRGEV